MKFISELMLVCILAFMFGVGLGITINIIIPNLITSIF